MESVSIIIANVYQPLPIAEYCYKMAAAPVIDVFEMVWENVFVLCSHSQAHIPSSVSSFACSVLWFLYGDTS